MRHYSSECPECLSYFPNKLTLIKYLCVTILQDILNAATNVIMSAIVAKFVGILLPTKTTG